MRTKPHLPIEESVRALAQAKLHQTVAARDESPRQFVVGTAVDNFCSILAEEGETADDQNLAFALRLDLNTAFAVAWDTGRSVFEVIEDGGMERLEEVLIDPEDEDQ